jgi:hypothetical protein
MKALNRLFSKSHLLIGLVTVTFNIAFSTPTFAGAHLGISGYQSGTHAELQKTLNSRAGASLSFDLFRVVRIGYSYRLDTESTSGLRVSDSSIANSYVNFNNIKEVTKQSVDLTIVPFMTQFIVPFIFGGIAKKDYLYRVQAEDVNDNGIITVEIKAGENGNPAWGWNAGFGTRIPVNKEFSIKVTQTFSEGLKKSSPTAEGVKVWDTYTEYGITYKL